MSRKPAFPALFVFGGCGALVLWAAFWIAVIWAVVHFIAKFW